MNHLRHYPFVFAWWVAASNSFSQTRRLRSLVAVGIGSIAVTVLLVGVGFASSKDRLHWIGEYEAWVAVLAVTHGAFLIAHGRRQWTRELSQSWPAATQLGATTLKRSVFLRTIGALLVQLLAAIGALLILAAAQATTLQTAG